MRGTAVTLLEPIRLQAEADLGFDIDFEAFDFLTCQRRAALEPEAYDVYEQCFHNLDIVWSWGALQPIDTRRIADWDRVSGLAKEGSLSRFASRGIGDAPVGKLYVQPDGFLGPEPSHRIGMLPTVHNMDSFGFDARVFGGPGEARPSWAWLLDPRARGRIAIVDEPGIGFFDAAMAAEAAGEVRFADMGDMTTEEIDALMALLADRRWQGYFCAAWRDEAEAARLLRDGRVAIQSMWAPVYGAMGAMAGHFVEATPMEGYRAWHGGASLARHLAGPALDMAYDYLNWWLTAYPGAIMARQGHYMPIPERVREGLAPEEWAYWYEGAEAACDLAGPDGQVVVRAGTRRAGGSYWERAGSIAVWNTVMAEYNYAARAWDRFVRAVREGGS